jgi:Peptidase family M28
VSGRTHTSRAGLLVVVLVTALLAASCSRLVIDETVISSDAMNGRDNGTAGSAFAQSYLIAQLKQVGVGLDSSRSGDDAFKQPFDQGTNIVAKIPGGPLADEYVIIGAHYDHLGNTCRNTDASDIICNGATDNGAGTAAVLDIARKIKAAGTPRRTVVLALWDREEDGLLGSNYYVQHPIVPLAKTVAYVNFDIQGSNLLPSLRDTSFAVGAETGGARLQTAVKHAIAPSTLQTRLVSAIFGQGRSDYVNFTNAGVPNVFFSDSTGPCYHTAKDELEVVDFTKLERQVDIGYRVAQDLITGTAPAFSAANPVATFDDAVALASVTNSAQSDRGRFTADQQAQLDTFRNTLNTIVADGPANFDNNDVATVIAGAATSVQLLTTGTCDGFLK